MATGAAVVAADMAWVWPDERRRWALALAGLAVFTLVPRPSLANAGLRAPEQGAGYWLKGTALIGGGVGTFIAAVLTAAWLLRWPFTVYATEPSHLARRFLHMCVFAPLVEECLYRAAVCVPGRAVLGPWGAVLVSGALFAALHFVYGNPSPDNFIAGFFLAWAYLKSGSLFVPIALHALGNACALSAQLAAWYWLAGR